MHIVHRSNDTRHCTNNGDNDKEPCLAVVAVLFTSDKAYAKRHNLAEAKDLAKLL